MKTFKFHRLPLFSLAAALLLFAACQSEEMTQEITTDQNTVSEAEIEELPVYAADLLNNPTLQEATIEEEIAIVSDGLPEELEEENAAVMRDSNGHRWSLLACFDTVQLSAGQKDSIRAISRRFHHCRKFHIHEVRVINRTIISQANQQRKILVRKFKVGEITRAQLIRKLTQLNNRTRNALLNNPEKLRHIKHVRACYFKYFRGIHHILDEAQWNEFIHCYRNR